MTIHLDETDRQAGAAYFAGQALAGFRQALAGRNMLRLGDTLIPQCLNVVYAISVERILRVYENSFRLFCAYCDSRHRRG